MVVTAQARKASGPTHVGVTKKLRQAYSWFEALAESVKNQAISKRRRAERAKGPQLKPEKVVELVDELEKIQQQLNPLLERRETLVGQLLPHWAHTGVEEIEGKLGKTLIATSFELTVNPGYLEQALSKPVWQKVTERALQPIRLLAEGKENADVRTATASAMQVKKLRVSVISPSSRRPKSGKPEGGQGEDESEEE